jgi:hypothetical protein
MPSLMYDGRMSHRCAPRARRFHNGVSCLSMALMRDVLKDIKRRSTPAVAATIRPYARAHNTKATLFQHLATVVGNADDEAWGGDAGIAGPLREKLRSAFKPVLTVGANDWLTSNSVTDFLSSLGSRFKTFKPLGWYDSNHLDRMLKILRKARTGVQPTRFAGVINLGGLHYVAVYFDVKACSVEYFDSFGHGPDAKVRAFLDEAIAHLETKHGCQFALRTPKIAHQTVGRECGMYALWFVLQRLQGKTYAWTQKLAVPDAQMAALRPVYFRT